MYHRLHARADRPKASQPQQVQRRGALRSHRSDAIAAVAMGFLVELGVECPSHGRNGSPKGPGDPPEGATLVPQLESALQLLQIEPLVGDAEADPRLDGKVLEGLTAMNVSTQQRFPAKGCQPGVRVGTHGEWGQWIGVDTRATATSHTLVS